MKDSKVVTRADVKATAVQSMTDDSAVVLVAAASEVSNSASNKQPPRGWRLSVTLQQDNGQPKMSKVEFVPPEFRRHQAGHRRVRRGRARRCGPHR